MDTNRKKQLKEAYANRKREMGVMALTCTETGEVFLGTTKDLRADTNSIKVKLGGGQHPNKHLQQLWNQYGEDGFTISLFEELEYEDPHLDYSEELEELRELCFTENPDMKRIWK